jgi:sugar phosphate isomerase/epimerase
VGERASDEGETLREIAELTGGEYFAVADLADISFLNRARLTGLDAVTVRNKRSGEPARALRSFPDGSFDALVPLAPGANEIEIEARVAGRAPLLETRTIVYEPGAAGDSARDARAAELLRKLRERTEAIALRVRLEAERSAREQQRVLTLEMMDVSAGPPEAD